MISGPICQRLKKMYAGLAASGSFRAALPPLLAVFFSLASLLLVWLSFSAGSAEADVFYTRSGSFLLAGLPYGDIARNMPLFSAVFSAAARLGLNSNLVFILLHLAVYGLVFCAGRLLAGYRAGVLSLVLAGLFGAVAAVSYNPEQAFYSFQLLLVFSLLLIRRRENTLRNAVLLGLSIGASLLVRTPLFLFPPVLVLCEWLYGKDRSRAFFLRSAAFLAASYVLLLPWGFLNYSVEGKFSFFDSRRAACNIITAAKGSISLVEGDPLRLAGIGPGDSVLKFYLEEVKKAPLAYALSMAARLWHILLFYPVLFGLALLALARSRAPDRALLFCLPVYFILVHLPLSAGERYFYPLLYLLPPLIAAGWSAGGRADGGGLVRKWVYAAGLFSFVAVLALEALLIVYPFRAARSSGGAGAGAAPGLLQDRALAELACQESRRAGDYTGFHACLEGLSDRFGDKFSRDLLAVLGSAAPGAVPLPAYGGEMKYRTAMNSYIIRMLRALELGDRAAARAWLERAYAVYEAAVNMVHWEPYEKEKRRDLLLMSVSGSILDRYLYRGCRLKAASDAAAAAACPAEPSFPLEKAGPGRLAVGAYSVYYGYKKLISAARGDPYRRDREVSLAVSGDSDSFWGSYVHDMLVLWPPERRPKILAGMKKDAAFAGSGALTESLAKNAGASGEFRGRRLNNGAPPGAVSRAPGLVTSPAARAEVRTGSDPRALLQACTRLAAGGKKQAALRACQAAEYAVSSSTGPAAPDLELLAADALFQSYKLLGAMGRAEEAAESLRWAVSRAPAGWQRLAEARRALEAAPGK